MHEYIPASDLVFGDIVINHFDPAFRNRAGLHGDLGLSAEVYRLVAYALFANRLIVPSRYLLQPCVSYKSLIALEGLLEAGIIVPDLREGCLSFREHLEREGVTDSERLACADYLDRHAGCIYSFDVKGESSLYHERLLGDLAEGGVLRKKLVSAGAPDVNIDAFSKAFEECEGSRRTFERLANRFVPGNSRVISDWAALRYYTTPAELIPLCIRDFPYELSQELRADGLSVPLAIVDPDGRNALPQPMRLCHETLLDLPENLPMEDLKKLSDIVIAVRQQVPNSSAKFASLTEKGFTEGLHEINVLFAEELAREQRFSSRTKSFVFESMLGELPAIVVTWGLGFCLGQSIDIGPAGDVALGVATSAVTRAALGRLSKTNTPFLETNERLRTESKKRYNRVY